MTLYYSFSIRNYSNGTMGMRNTEGKYVLDERFPGSLIPTEAPETKILLIECTSSAVILKILRRHSSRILTIQNGASERYSVTENAFGFDITFTWKGYEV